ncbi:MAG: hypothetical protein OZSIB_0995 [Candidatus Ozemobacter sibiricus]|uniref:DUF2760 domain-containing protein n=1 Tax=Candidatus Ozemobacter sibiricus TaxID=2268124 RepID=A0A367ZL70_9BACT|nr:MAG: hypothetical protein OZSIB_0995 [Candidatus Ozemobacter sibiricus]
MLKRLAALLTILGILAGTFLLVKFWKISPLGPCFAEWAQVSLWLPQFWQVALIGGALFLLAALIPAMHTLFPPPPPPPPPPDPQLLATIENGRQKIKDLEAEIEEGEARQLAFQAEAARAQTRISELEAQLAHVTNELHSYQEKDSTLINDYQRAQDRCTELNQELIEMADRHRLAVAERDQARRELAQLTRELAEARQLAMQAQAAAEAAMAESRAIAAAAERKEREALLARKPEADLATAPGPTPTLGEEAPPPLPATPAAATAAPATAPASPSTVAAPAPPTAPTAPAGEAPARVAPDAAFQILYLLQKEGRLLDFLAEDLSGVDDDQLGGAIRPIHEGLRRLLTDRLVIAPVLNLPEGETVELGDPVDPERVKLTGNVPARGPYKGTLIHKGWRLKECRLPALVAGWSGDVIVPAEVEIP